MNCVVPTERYNQILPCQTFLPTTRLKCSYSPTGLAAETRDRVGWAFILRHPATGKELESSGGERETTNNRMEMTAVIRGLEALKRAARVEIISDSIYVGKGFSEWMPKWKLNGWRRREGNQLKPIKTRSSGGRWTNCWPSIRSASRTSVGIKAIRRTNVATPWPWRRIRNTVDLFTECT